MALSAAAGILIARHLGVTVRGQWASISVLALLIGTLAMVGLGPAAAFAAARVGGSERLEIVRGAAIAAFVLAVGGALLYLPVFAVAGPEGLSFGIAVGGGALAASSVLLGITGQIVLTTAPVGWFAAVQVLPAAGMLTAVGALGSQLRLGYVISLSVATALLGVVLALLGIGRQGLIRPDLPFPTIHQVVVALRPYAGFALLTFGTVVLTQVVQRFDVLLIQWFRGSREAGLYAVAVQITELLLIVPAALGFFVFRLGAREAEGHWRQTRALILWTAGAGTLTALLIELAAPDVIEVVFGAQYADSLPAARWLLPGAVFLGVQAVVSSYLASRGRPRSVLLAWGVGAVFGLGLSLLAIPRFGISGAAAVSSGSYLLVLILHLRALYEMHAAETRSEQNVSR